MPLPLSVKVTPDGRTPDSEMLGVGLPVVVTVKVFGNPTTKIDEAVEVMAGTSFTVMGLPVTWEAAR